MGNRGGCFHTAEKTLTRRRWVSRRWIVCVLQFRGRKREVMGPRHYTELFFLDEATALAAGHRPCRECRHADHQRFKRAWLRGNAPAGLSASPSIDEVDRVIHAERLGPGGVKRAYRARLGELPDGVFVLLDESSDTAHLLSKGLLWKWAPGGYSDPVPLSPDAEAQVLTPRSIVHAIAAGYPPSIHGAR
jgi:hypothetical protein